MKRVRTVLVRASVAALLLMALAGSVAYADDGGTPRPDGSSGSTQLIVPEDPGIE
jgi:hypothetical protein